MTAYCQDDDVVVHFSQQLTFCLRVHLSSIAVIILNAQTPLLVI